MIPWLIAGAIGAIIADEIIDDKVVQPKLNEKKEKEYPSDSEVPDWAKDDCNSTKK